MRFTKAQYISEHRCDTRLSIVVSVANGMHSIFNFIHTVMWSCFCVSRLSCLWVRESRFACLRQSTDRNISTSLADDDIYITITFTMLESKEKKTEPHTQQHSRFWNGSMTLATSKPNIAKHEPVEHAWHFWYIHSVVRLIFLLAFFSLFLREIHSKIAKSLGKVQNAPKKKLNKEGTAEKRSGVDDQWN